MARSTSRKAFRPPAIRNIGDIGEAIGVVGRVGRVGRIAIRHGQPCTGDLGRGQQRLRLRSRCVCPTLPGALPLFCADHALAYARKLGPLGGMSGIDGRELLPAVHT